MPLPARLARRLLALVRRLRRRNPGLAGGARGLHRLDPGERQPAAPGVEAPGPDRDRPRPHPPHRPARPRTGADDGRRVMTCPPRLRRCPRSSCALWPRRRLARRPARLHADDPVRPAAPGAALRRRPDPDGRARRRLPASRPQPRRRVRRPSSSPTGRSSSTSRAARGRGGFQILTPHAIASVRGTQWAVDVGATRTSVFVERGQSSRCARPRVPRRDALRAGEGVDVDDGATSLRRQALGAAAGRRAAGAPAALMAAARALAARPPSPSPPPCSPPSGASSSPAPL